MSAAPDHIATAPAPAPAPAREDHGRKGFLASSPWAVVFLLMLIGILNFVDRVLPAVLAEPMRRELNLSDTVIGFINGIGFLLVYAVAGIPIARISDRGFYGAVIGAALTLWSAMTVLGGLAQTAWQLILTRMGVALGEAGNTPAAHAYISRNIAPQQRALALAVFTLAAPLGSMVGFMGGGYLGEHLGWRNTFILMGVIGLLLAPVLLLAIGSRQAIPRSVDSDGRTQPMLPFILKRSFLAIILGSSLISFGGYAATAFAPTFLIRTHGLSTSEVGLQLGLLSGVIGVCGLLGASLVADRLSAKDPRWSLGVIALMVTLLLPFAVAAFLVQDAFLAMVLVASIYMVIVAHMAPAIVAIHRLVPLEMRARASAVLLFCAAVFGGLGPLFTGMLSDSLRASMGEAALAQALMLVPASYGLAVIFFVAATVTFKRDIVEAKP